MNPVVTRSSSFVSSDGEVDGDKKESEFIDGDGPSPDLGLGELLRQSLETESAAATTEADVELGGAQEADKPSMTPQNSNLPRRQQSSQIANKRGSDEEGIIGEIRQTEVPADLNL